MSKFCKMKKSPEECSKYMKLRNEKPNAIITCESTGSEVGKNKVIGSCYPKITDQKNDYYFDRSWREDGSMVTKHIDSI